MSQNQTLFALARQTVTDPIEGARAVMALRLPTPLRWMLLAAAILVSVILLYSLPVLTGQAAEMPAPWVFAAGQFALNVVVVCLVAFVGRAFGGTGGFDDALLLMAWLQAVTVGFLLLQLVMIMVMPALNFVVTIASVIISMWMLTGFICALHGFRSQALVLVGGVMVFTITTFVLSVLLLLLGVDFSGVPDV